MRFNCFSVNEFTQKKTKTTKKKKIAHNRAEQKNNENNKQQPLRQQQHAMANCTEIARNKQPATADHRPPTDR